MRRLLARTLSSLAILILVLPVQLARAESPFDATIPLSQLPGWVQVAVTAAPLFVGDTGSQGLGVRLQRNTFMRVVGGGTRRLLVEAVTDTGQSGQRGWIDPDDVAPSAPAEGWLVASRATTLYQSPAAESTSVRSLDQFTPLLQQDGPVQGRVQVRVYRSDFLAVADAGWVSLDDVGPALAPATRVVAPYGGYLRSSVSATQTERPFLDVAAEAAMASSARTGVPASVTVAQAILESDWGRSSLSRSAGNYFGMKAIGGLGNDGVVWMPTTEYDAAGERYETLSPFRAYKSLTDSMLDHDLLLRDAPRYASAMQVRHDPRQFAHMLVQGGYATDPAYADKLIALMDRYDLYRLDA